jgi:hypothetical protein
MAEAAVQKRFELQRLARMSDSFFSPQIPVLPDNYNSFGLPGRAAFENRRDLLVSSKAESE